MSRSLADKLAGFRGNAGENGVARSFGLVFRVPEELKMFFASVRRDLSSIHDNDSWFLPIPAAYVVDRKGTIAHACVNPDFRERRDPAETVRVLSALK
jgi:hypothetical protein